jgi:predicted DNA-binding transcriptional regulator AlpA
MPTDQDHRRLPPNGLVRIHQFVGPGRVLPIGRSTWWAGVKDGRFPPPVKSLGPRISAWRAQDIQAVVDGRWPGLVSCDSKRPRGTDVSNAQ